MGTRNITTAAVLRLLEQGEAEEICGASLVLGALRPTDKRVVPALGRALKRAPRPVKPYLLDALARTEDPRAVRHILPYLLEQGSLREQAIRILARKRLPVLEHLRRLHRRGDPETRQAIARILVALESEEALDQLVDTLPVADFGPARTVFSTVRRHLPSWPARLRRHLAHAVARLLEGPDCRMTVSGEVCAVKLLGILESSRGIRALLQRTASGTHRGVRRDALEALAHVTLPRSRRRTLENALCPLLDDPEPQVAAGALRVLGRLDPPSPDPDVLVRLSRAPHGELAALALRQLGRSGSRASLDPLLQALRREEPPIREAAAATLRQHPDAVAPLLAAHEDPGFQHRRELIREILHARPEPPEGAPRKELRRLLDPQAPKEVLGARLLALGALDRRALNRAVEARVRQALARGHREPVFALLEPLVRNRLASPLGRYLLAVAHLQEAGAGAGPEDPAYRRAMNLLGPLARLPGWSLRRQLARERRLGPELLELIVAHMIGRPEPERSLAAYLESRRLGRTGSSA